MQTDFFRVLLTCEQWRIQDFDEGVRYIFLVGLGYKLNIKSYQNKCIFIKSSPYEIMKNIHPHSQKSNQRKNEKAVTANPRYPFYHYFTL